MVSIIDAAYAPDALGGRHIVHMAAKRVARVGRIAMKPPSRKISAAEPDQPRLRVRGMDSEELATNVATIFGYIIVAESGLWVITP